MLRGVKMALTIVIGYSRRNIMKMNLTAFLIIFLVLSACQSERPVKEAERPNLDFEFVIAYRSFRDGTVPADFNGREIYLDPVDRMGFNSIKKISISRNKNTGQPQVEFIFHDYAAEEFMEITGNHIFDNMVIIYEGEIIYMLNIIEKISGGRAVLSGLQDNEFAPFEMLIHRYFPPVI